MVLEINVCIIKLSLLLLTINVGFTNPKEINIKIDSEDLMKILKGLLYTDKSKTLAAQIYRGATYNQNLYNNPYHPEDDAAIDEKVKTIELKKNKNQQEKTKKPKKHKKRHHRSMTQTSLEKDNEVFIKEKVDSQEEIVQENVDGHIKYNKVPATNDIKRRDDKHNFHRLQTRFEKITS